jgi:hypothetical protein
LDEASNVKWGMIQYGDGVGAGLSNALTIYQATNTADAAVNQYRLVINDAGNVGIGTNSPTAKLHVGGTAGTDGIRFPDGTLQTTAAAGVGNICFCIQFRCNGGTNVGTEQCGTWGNYTSYAAPTTNCAGLGQAENARIRLYTCP